MTRINAPWLTDAAAQKVCGMLVDAGYQAWFVGGCVRNALLGAPVADLDLSTDAHPDTVIALAKAAGCAVVPTGIAHGTVTVIAQNVHFEITTFRRDVATDGRRATVAFADNMVDDARRRDFTMNALYAGPDGVVVDPLGGLPDLEARRVRFIEDADQRIKEDYLRILRYFRFHAWYGDVDEGPDPDALAACAANVEGLQSLSSERITSELLNLLAAPDPAPAVGSMDATGGLVQILPGANAPMLAVLVHVEGKAGLAPDPLRRLAVLGGDTAGLRLSNDAKKRLDQMHNDFDAVALGYYFGAQAALDNLAVRAASLGQEIDPNSAQYAIFAAKQTFPLKAADLMPELHGPALGAALQSAKTRWIASGFTLTKAELMDD
ncbi:CCA tRNA nucleotidyltransferase [Loktanella sp. D2R18]|uniref:CCA tRNA nucleotidyltransferase n=1 Tax=Rhodobacterales TaxID=204455 RepID=UPI000DEA7BBD|nr:MULTISPECIES: CCA tRNA nucleotidyltransferase [Rhodobacterales]MDO6590436.1 CCA tRNA nucleotidyltransferase [Yoonia sp. 1_MG-2023]RBW41159.1 CCA tRNA nucleotidyltransferase [Loktanella sp. D2R18]